MTRQGRFRILDERLEKRETTSESAPATADGGDAPDTPAEVENPYWTWDEQAPHPNPELGCVRRGLCCKSSPGWFAPGEVEAAAALRGMEPDAFVRKYLVVDHQEVAGEVVHVFAPVKLGIDGRPAIPPASRTDALYRALRGQCVFYDVKAQGCGIYEARPTECRLYICTNAPADNPTHEGIALLWRPDLAAAVAAQRGPSEKADPSEKA
ncbi:MAG: YkgJ family cysteine cluster protein [Deltaproteobacteria bacterium]|nr:YkgJ family cysteine cluster protein [Deltaproteobacteria bacterium]